MKDKEKQIEEMAKDIDWAKERVGDSKGIAIHLVNMDYRKIPKDSVVLSMEEKNALWLEAWNKATEQTRKETAEKFANEVYKELYQLGKIYALPETLDANKYGIFSLTQEIIAKIAKEQFGVEIKE